MSDQESPTIESLTEAASAAASRGEWNLVEAYYRKREAVLDLPGMTSTAIARVLALDGEVKRKVRLAQAGLAALLRDAESLRQRLRDVHRRAAVAPVDPGTFTKHV